MQAFSAWFFQVLRYKKSELLHYCCRYSVEKKFYNPTPYNQVVSYCKKHSLDSQIFTNADIIEAYFDRLLYIITDCDFLPIKRIVRCDVRKTRRKTFVNRSNFS